MERFQNWLVALDFSEIDKPVIKYTYFLSKIFNPQNIEFVHVTEKIPETIQNQLTENLSRPGYEELVQRMESTVNQIFQNTEAVSFEILDGAVNMELWRETYLKDTDLVIAGSKPPHLGRCLKVRKFIRSSFCSVLLVPHDPALSINKIWVPMDFSKPSAKALDQALHLANNLNPPAEVYTHHVYSMPHAYYYQDFPEAELMEAVKKDAEKQCRDFSREVNTYDLPLTAIFTEQTKAYAADHIMSVSEQHKADLVVMAASGRSKFTKLLLGSETEQLVHLHPNIPLLILKEKSRHFKLWELLNL